MAIGFPTVPRGKARIRVMISAATAGQTWTRAWRHLLESGVSWV